MNPLIELDVLISRTRIVDRRSVLYELVLYLVLISIGSIIYVILLTLLSVHVAVPHLTVLVVGVHVSLGFCVIIQGVKTGRRLRSRTTFLDSKTRTEETVSYEGSKDDLRRIFERWELDIQEGKLEHQDDISDILLFLLLFHTIFVIGFVLVSDEYLYLMMTLPFILSLLAAAGLIHSHIMSPGPHLSDLLDHLEFYVMNRVNTLESAFRKSEFSISLEWGQRGRVPVLHDIGLSLKHKDDSRPILEYRMGIASAVPERFLMFAGTHDVSAEQIMDLLPKEWRLIQDYGKTVPFAVLHRYRNLDVSDETTYLLAPSQIQRDTEEVVQIAELLRNTLLDEN